jgi:cytochrome c556
MFRTTLITALSLAALTAGGAMAQQDPLAAAVNARQAHMQLYAFNLGQLGAMAQGEMPYDAAMAQAFADDLVHLTSISQMAYWPEGSEAGMVEGSRAKIEIWSTFPAVLERSTAMAEAALAMQAAAGTLEGVQGAMGAVGGACGGCHEAFRVSN